MFTAARALSAIPGEQLYYSYTYGAPVEWMTLEGYDHSEHILLSYDVSGLARHQAARACHIVFGRRRRDGFKGDRIEPGFIHRPGVVWIGQSVLAMPPRDADELAGKLWKLGARVAMAPVSITPSGLRAFRRRGRSARSG